MTARVTPRAMRRTFNDMAREAGLDSIVKRSISGHQTEEMELHYSTARAREQVAGLAKVYVLSAGKRREG